MLSNSKPSEKQVESGSSVVRCSTREKESDETVSTAAHSGMVKLLVFLDLMLYTRVRRSRESRKQSRKDISAATA